MKIYTKTGDSGETSLRGGKRVKKTNKRINVIGTVDELNSWLGLVNSGITHKIITINIQREQSNLFKLGASLSVSENSKLQDGYLLQLDDIQNLENEIDEWSRELPELKNFILPGGSISASQIFIARSICRRAERELVSLIEIENIPSTLLVYINRLSDWLFTLARYLNNADKQAEIVWAGNEKIKN